MRGAVLAAAGFVVTTRRMSEHQFPRKHTATGRSTYHPAFQAEISAKWIICFWISQASPQRTRVMRINSSGTIVQSEHPNQTGQDVNTDHSQTLLQCHWCWTPGKTLSSLDCPKTKLLHDSFSRRYLFLWAEGGSWDRTCQPARSLVTSSLQSSSFPNPAKNQIYPQFGTCSHSSLTSC